MGSNELSILIKLLLASLAGGLVGLERETHGCPAGMRTNILVSVGAFTMMIVSEAFYLKYGIYGVQPLGCSGHGDGIWNGILCPGRVFHSVHRGQSSAHKKTGPLH